MVDKLKQILSIKPSFVSLSSVRGPLSLTLGIFNCALKPVVPVCSHNITLIGALILYDGYLHAFIMYAYLKPKNLFSFYILLRSSFNVFLLVFLFDGFDFDLLTHPFELCLRSLTLHPMEPSMYLLSVNLSKAG